MTKRKQQNTAWAEETGYPRHLLVSLLRVEMHPDGREHDDVEAVASRRAPARRGPGRLRGRPRRPDTPSGSRGSPPWPGYAG
jgi:hypothetical protein